MSTPDTAIVRSVIARIADDLGDWEGFSTSNYLPSPLQILPPRSEGLLLGASFFFYYYRIAFTVVLCLGVLVHFVVADKRSLAVGIVVNTGRKWGDREENGFGRRRGDDV